MYIVHVHSYTEVALRLEYSTGIFSCMSNTLVQRGNRNNHNMYFFPHDSLLSRAYYALPVTHVYRLYLCMYIVHRAESSVR